MLYSLTEDRRMIYMQEAGSVRFEAECRKGAVELVISRSVYRIHNFSRHLSVYSSDTPII